MNRSSWMTLLIGVFALVGIVLLAAVFIIPEKHDPDTEKEMVHVPKGTFYMGCEPELKEDCSPNEFPRHRVRLDGFWIDKYETTCAQYAEFLNKYNPQNDCFGYDCVSLEPEHDRRNIRKIGDKWVVDAGYENRPVLYVTWYGAKAYCERKGNRLPTEAQWEKTAKGTAHFSFPWGENWVANTSNYARQGDPFEGKGKPETTPIGMFDGRRYKGYQTADGRSPYGISDMAGNAKEWTSDWYDRDYYKKRPFAGWKNPQGPESGVERIIKGASWSGDPRSSRISYRIHMAPNYRDDALGFRCARDE